MKLDIPCLDVLDEYLFDGYYIIYELGKVYLFDKYGKSFVYGDTLRDMLVNLIMADGAE